MDGQIVRVVSVLVLYCLGHATTPPHLRDTMDPRLDMRFPSADEDAPNMVPIRGVQVVDKDADGRERAMTPEDWLFKNRTIRFYYEVNTQSVADLQAKLMYLDSVAAGEPIYLYINSPGGSIFAMLSAYDTMMSLKSPVYTYCDGMAASAASLLFMAGAPGHRTMLPNAFLMIHQLRGGGSNGPFTDQETNYVLSRYLEEKRMEAIYAEHTGLSPEKVKDLMRNGDHWLNSKEAVNLKLADAVRVTQKGSVPRDSIQSLRRAITNADVRRVRTPSKTTKTDAKLASTKPQKNQPGLDK